MRSVSLPVLAGRTGTGRTRTRNTPADPDRPTTRYSQGLSVGLHSCSHVAPWAARVSRRQAAPSSVGGYGCPRARSRSAPALTSHPPARRCPWHPLLRSFQRQRSRRCCCCPAQPMHSGPGAPKPPVGRVRASRRRRRRKAWQRCGWSSPARRHKGDQGNEAPGRMGRRGNLRSVH
jgi:hypothetical protein